MRHRGQCNTLKEKKELERASATLVRVIGREELEFQ